MKNIEDNKNAIIKKDDIYNKKTKAIPKPNPNVGIDNGSFYDNIIATGTTGQLDISAINTFSQASQRRDQIYNLLDMMGQDSIISAILETYAEDATEYNEEGRIVFAKSDDPKVLKFIYYLIDTLQFDKHIYDWVYNLCKYGDLYLELYRESEIQNDLIFKPEDNDKKVLNEDLDKQKLNEDIKIKAFSENDKYIHYLNAIVNAAEMFELTRFGKTIGYIKADVSSSIPYDNITNVNSFMYKYKKSDVTIFDNKKFVHAILDDTQNRIDEEVKIFLTDDDYKNNTEDKSIKYKVRKGQSLLYNTFKIWRELNLLENSILLNRVTKSSIVRMINVEVGDMPKEMVGPHLQGIKSLMEQKSAIDTGNSMSEYTNPGPIENNVYVPTHNGLGAITSTQIGGEVNVGQLPDIKYFQDKFFGSLRAPKQYFGILDDNAGFSGGQSLAIISSRYAKMIKRIQKSILQALTDAINLYLIDKGLNSYIGEFTLCIQTPTTQEEIDRRDNVSSKIGIVNDIMNMLTDIEDTATKLRILKSLLSNIITDNEVVKLIDEEIVRLEEETTSEINDKDMGLELDNSEPSSNINSEPSSSNMPLDLDAELGLEEPAETETIESDETILPTPEETGVDMTDNSNIE